MTPTIGPWSKTILAVDVVALAAAMQSQVYGDVTFTNGELLLIGSLLGAVVSALLVLFRLVIKMAEARAERAERLVDDLVPTITGTAGTVKEMAGGLSNLTDLVRSLIPTSSSEARRNR